MKKIKQKKIKQKKKTTSLRLRPFPKNLEKGIDFKEDSRQNTGQAMLYDLEQVASLVIQLQSKISLINQAKQRVLDLAVDIDRLKLEEIPAIMDQFNLSEVKLKDGSKVQIRPFVHASLPSEGAILKCRDGEQRVEMRERLNKAFRFLRSNGAGALIKTLLKADFGKDSEAKAAKALKQLQKLGINAEISKGVHPQTLNAWVRERLEDGKAVDMDLFKVFSGQIAEITTPNMEQVI